MPTWIWRGPRAAALIVVIGMAPSVGAEPKRFVPLALEGDHHYELFKPQCYGQRPLSRYYSDRSRTRNYYGLPKVVRAITQVAAHVRRRHPDAARLAIGEISNATGGKIPFHNSHRKGVDVDIAYLVRAPGRASGDDSAEDSNPARRHPISLCSLGPSYERMVAARGGWQLDPKLDLELNWTLAAELSKRRDVKSIFVGGLVRPALLEWGRTRRRPRREQRLVRQKLRYVRCRGTLDWTYRKNPCPHDDHFHVRFKRRP